MKYIDYNENDIQEFEYETTMISDGSVVGTCELGKATIKLLNDSNEYSVFKGSWIKTVHGSFYIYDVKPVQEKINIELTCYDIKYKLDTLYETKKYTFPLTLKKWRNSIFDNCGVKYDDSDFPNSDLILKKEPYIENGASNRTVIKMIAQAGASSVITDKNDIFYFSWFTDNVFLVDDWLELTTEKVKTDSINTVVLGRGDTEDNVYYPEQTQNPIEFRIDNNYILDPQDTDSDTDIRYKTIKPIYNRINGFSYLIFDIRTQQIDNKLSLTLGDKIKYYDIYDNELEAYVMTKKLTYLGGDLADDTNYEMTLSAEKINETSTDLSYSSKIENKILSVERKADKQAGVILDEVKKIDSTLNSITTTNKTVSNKNSLYVEDALEENALEFRVKGKSEQTTRSGKNVLKLEKGYTLTQHGVTFKVNDDYSVTLNGTCDKDNVKFDFNCGAIPLTGIYTLSIKYISGSVSNVTSYTQIQIIRTSDWAGITRKLDNKDCSNTLQLDGTYNYCNIRIDNNVVLSNYTIKIQLEKNNTATNWEEYGVSPSPDYPSEINTIKGIENLFNYYKNFISNRYGLASVINDDGSITTIGKPAGNYISVVEWQDITDKLENGEIYTLSQENNNTKLYTQLRLTKTSDSSYTYITANNGPQNITINKSIYSKYEICLITTTTANWGNDDLTITNKYMFCKGIYTASDNFIPYGNWLVEKISNKNVIPLKQYNYTSKGITVTTDIETGIITINGTCESNNTPFVIYDDFILNGSYSFNLIYLSGTISNTTNTTRLHIADSNWANQFYLPFANSNNYTFRENISNITYKNHFIRIDKGVTFNNYKVKAQLVKGTNSDYNYEPHKSQNVLINLKNNELCSNKDLSVRDELVVTETETYIDKHIKKIILDGSDDEGYLYVANNSVNGFSQFNYTTKIDNIDFSDNGSKVLCTHLNYYVDAHRNTKTLSGIRLYANNPAFVFSIPDTIAKTVEELRTYLSNNPFEIYYVLSTPEKIELEKVDIPLYENINNLTLLEDLETDTSVKYLTNNVTNQMYATRSQLKIAENSIRTDINAKFKGYSTTTEMNNTIEQKITDSENAISLKVEQVDKKTSGSINEIKGSLELKISKDENDEIVSMLNASAKEINLKSNRFSLESDKTKIKKDGTVEFTGGTIGGFELTKNEFKTNISVTRNYTQNDLNKVQQYLLGQATLTNEEIDYYDANGDGTINLLDLLLIQKVISGTDSATVTGMFELNSSSSLKSLRFKDSDGKTTTSVGINGIGTKCISADTISVNDIRKKDGNPFFSSGCNLLSSIGSYITTDTLISYFGEYDLYIAIGKIASNDIGRVTAVVPSIAITQSGTSINIADNSGFVSGLFTVNSSNQVLFRHRARSGTGYIEQIFGVKL